jgi:hypothetical protein
MKLAAGKGSLGQSAVSIAEVDTAIERFLKDPDWVKTILAIDDLVTWGQIDEYRSLIEPLVAVKSKPLSAMAAKVLGERRESETQPMSLSERTLKLSQIDLFRSLSVNQLVEVASVTEEVRFAPETEISFGDEASRGLHLIVAGEVSVEQERPDSQAGAAELARFGPGQSIGIAMLFGQFEDSYAAGIGHAPHWHSRVPGDGQGCSGDLPGGRPGIVRAAGLGNRDPEKRIEDTANRELSGSCRPGRQRPARSS